MYISMILADMSSGFIGDGVGTEDDDSADEYIKAKGDNAGGTKLPSINRTDRSSRSDSINLCRARLFTDALELADNVHIRSDTQRSKSEVTRENK